VLARYVRSNPNAMSEYRSALRAARERIEQLEADVPVCAVPRPKLVSGERLVGLLAITLPLVAAMTLCCLSLHGAWPKPRETIAMAAPVPPPVPPAPPPEGLEWMAQTWFAPTLAGPVVTGPDVVGARAIVGLAWDRAREEDGMYAVAFDYATLAPRWRAGPYPSFRARDGVQAHHLALVGDRVVVTDLRGGVHVLDARTGEERALKKLPNAPFGACVTGAGASARLILPLDPGWRPHDPKDPSMRSHFPWEKNKVTVALDPSTGRTTPAPPYTNCESDHYCMWRHVDGCRDLEQRDSAPDGKLHLSVQEVWNWENDRVSLGSISGATGRPDHAPAAAVGWDASTRAVRWETRLTTPERPRASESVAWGVLGASAFFYLYTTADGPARVVGLDSKTGERRFDVEVPGSAIGTRLHDLNAKADDAFVSLNEELLVFDGASGRLRGRLGGAR
jgi:hypothetical protein